MTSLTAGQSLLLNNRLWHLRQVRPRSARVLELEAIGASEAAQGMARRLQAIVLGRHLFIARPRHDYWQANLDQDWQPGDFGPVLACRPATRLDLLDAFTQQPPAGDLPNEFSWSFSRQALYQKCPRAYYYHYYAAWEGWQADAPEPVRQTYLLKNLTNIPAWTGQLVHDAIKFALGRRQGGRPATPTEVAAQMHRRARADFRASQAGHFLRQPNQQVGFREHYYRESAPPAAWREAWQNARRYLLTFFNSALVGQFAPDSFLSVEALHSFAVEGVKIWVQIDLACREPDTIHLYDWKTGPIDEDSARRQLGIYALFAHHTWPEHIRGPIRGTVLGLADGRRIDFEFAPADLQAVQSTITASIAGLQALLLQPAQANLAELRRFPQIPNGEVCRQCQFKALCGRD